MNKPKVYFTRRISPEAVVEAYEKLGIELKGKTAVKVHSGEAGNQNFLRPEFMKPMIEKVDGTIVECNTAYEGQRNYTDKHKKLMEAHGWSKYFDVDIMDAEGDDLELKVNGGKILKSNFVGKNIKNYDSMLVLSHFKGHPMGGYGGALKQLAIGCASSSGKTWIHTGGKVKDQEIIWKNTAKQDVFLESMADAALTVMDYFKDNIAFVNVMCNMSVDCDCCAVAEDPKIKDIGILSSLDPVALDQACIDLVYSSCDEGKKDLIERIESKHGIHTIEASEELKIGSREYELIEF